MKDHSVVILAMGYQYNGKKSMITSICDASYGGLAFLFTVWDDGHKHCQAIVCVDCARNWIPDSLRFIYGSLKCKAHNLGPGNFGGSSIQERVRNVVKLGEQITLQ